MDKHSQLILLSIGEEARHGESSLLRHSADRPRATMRSDWVGGYVVAECDTPWVLRSLWCVSVQVCTRLMSDAT